MVDLVAPIPPAGARFATTCEALDLTTAGAPERLIAARPDVVFLLAAVVAATAERDFEKGYTVNLDATRRLFEAIRHERGASSGAYFPARDLRLLDRRLRRAVPRGDRR